MPDAASVVAFSRSSDGSPTRAVARPATVLAIVCGGVVLASLDLFIVNLALPQIARDFHGTSLADLSWALNGYAIVFAALLIPAGRLSDRAGRKGGFLLGVAVFTSASACCAAASGVELLVAFRVVQAVGAALLLPTSLSLVLQTYPPERRGGAVRTWAAMGGLAAALGPVLGGLLVTASWRWVFLVNVPIGIVALVAGWRWLPKLPGDLGPLPDALGAALLTLGIAALTLALIQTGNWGWGSARVMGLLVSSTVLIAGFVARSARHASPVLELRLLRVRSYSVTLVAALLFSAAFGAMLLSIALWLQGDWGWSALKTGLAIAPGPLMVLPLSVLAGKLIPRLGPGLVIATGCAFFAGGVIWWAAAVSLHANYVADVLGGMLLTGTGVGLTLPTLFSTATASLPPHRFATGSAAVSMVRQIGFAVGVAVLVGVLGTATAPQARLVNFHHGWIMVAILSLVGGASALLLRQRPAQRLTRSPR